MANDSTLPNQNTASVVILDNMQPISKGFPARCIKVDLPDAAALHA
jgi:hypothetical protein